MMTRCGLLVAILAASSFAHTDILQSDVAIGGGSKQTSLTVVWNGNGFDFVYQSEQGPQLVGVLASGSIPSDLPPPEPCDQTGLCWSFGSMASLSLTPTLDGQCHFVEWKSQFDSLADCFDMGQSHWYGGGEVFDQSWPIDGDTALMGDGGRPDVPYVTGDFFHNDFAGVLEPYWINTDGFGFYALRENPLFVSWNSSGDHQLCLKSRYEFPYPRPIVGQELGLRYFVCSTSDVKSMHLLALSQGFWSKPRDTPDQRVFEHPIWSTWARYKTLVNEARVLSYAAQIRQYGFNDSQLEIDDRWESCYGEHQFDADKFPDPAAMVNQLHSQGFRVTLWIHPFINVECASFSEASAHVVSDANGLPALTSWWQGNLAGYFDFTRPSSGDWWSARIFKLKTDFGFDGFKIDAGETNWLPSGFDFSSRLPTNATPNGYSTAYVRTMERFGGMTEVRTGWAAQDVPIFTRMLDKSTAWGKANGLATLIPTLLQFGLEGYPFVLPDMIGGNGYNTVLPDRELFIRWMQANVFMPTMQFSYTPWDYDLEVIDIALKMTSLHYQYSGLIVTLARQAMTNGYPINRPLWWIDPTDPVAQTIDSEYLLGDDVLVAPVLQTGAVTKDIYLPKGVWRDEADPSHPVYTGPMWLYSYPAPLDILPYFTRVSPLE
ncbi:myogenesis-regulating glycosidase-like [Daphnia carinata]|uniref:myogenesis-regulating glycosidase-like n=1 Tax=Daphnia carinata TaxID=120202 RepID=UPI00257C8DCA|nr:myogenesis-regulating glycosidase-like [Daphnia carinata]